MCTACEGSSACSLLVRYQQYTRSHNPVPHTQATAERLKKEVRVEDVVTELLPFSGTQRPWPLLLSHSLSITVQAEGQRGSLHSSSIQQFKLKTANRTRSVWGFFSCFFQYVFFSTPATTVVKDSCCEQGLRTS